MNTRRICVVLTSRGNYGKMKSIMRLIQSDPFFDLRVVVGGSLLLDKYGRILDSEFTDHIPISYQLNFVIEGENLATMAKSAGLALIELSSAFQNLQPDVVIVIADRFECLPVAMAAAYMNIPVAHVEGGEISGSIDESIRHAIQNWHTCISQHLLVPPSESFVWANLQILCFASVPLALMYCGKHQLNWNLSGNIRIAMEWELECR